MLLTLCIYLTNVKAKRFNKMLTSILGLFFLLRIANKSHFYAPDGCLFLNQIDIRSSLKDSRTNFFSPSIFSSSTNLFILGDFNCHHPTRTQKVLPTLVERKHSIGSSLLTSSSSMTLTYLLIFIAPLAVAPLLTSLLLPPLLLLGDASGPGF